MEARRARLRRVHRLGVVMSALKEALLKAKIITEDDVERVAREEQERRLAEKAKHFAQEAKLRKKKRESMILDALALVLVRIGFADAPGHEELLKQWPRWAEEAVRVYERSYTEEAKKSFAYRYRYRVFSHLDKHLMQEGQPLRSLWEEHAFMPWTAMRLRIHLAMIEVYREEKRSRAERRNGVPRE